VVVSDEPAQPIAPAITPAATRASARDAQRTDDDGTKDITGFMSGGS
jgi:hypothetical protein